MRRWTVLDFPYTIGAFPEGVLLPASHSVVLPALCLGRVPHDGKLELPYGIKSSEDRIWIVRESGMLARGLIVDQGPVQDGEVWTEVFNLSNQQIIIRKGEVISRLVAL